jgi:hypothetical protein
VNCPKCNQPTLPGACFCGLCGTAVAAGPGCPACGQPTETDAQFCGLCGTALAQADAAKADAPGGAPSAEEVLPELEAVNGHLIWNLQPGVVGRVLSPRVLSSFEGAKCLTIQPGARALIFGDGAFLEDLSSGTIRIPPASRAPGERQGGLLGAGSGLRRFLADLILGKPRPAGGQHPGRVQAGQALHAAHLLQVALVRDGAFKLVLAFPRIQTATLRTEVGLQAVVEVSDARAFHAAMLVDHAMVSAEAVASLLQDLLTEPVARFFRTLSPLDWSEGDARLAGLAAELQKALALTHGWLRVVRVFKVAVEHEAVERLHTLKEELYVSEQELEQLTARQDFENRLRLTLNQRQVTEARDGQELHRQLQAVNQDQLISEDELAKFQLLMRGDREIREARSADEVQAALDDLRGSGFMREATLQELASSIANRQEDQQLQRGHTLAILEAQQRLDLDRARLTWESEIHDREIEQELERQRKAFLAQVQFESLKVQAQRHQDDYADERRRARQEQDQQEMLAQLELARQAQALAESGKGAAHERELALRQLQLAHEAQMRGILKEMTVDQIMAANPDITPEAARALAERSKAEGALNAAGQSVAMAEKQKEDMQAFMNAQMATMQQMMHDLLASNAQIAGGAIQEQRQQADAAAQRAETAADRTARTAQAMAGALGRPAPFCPRCGRPMPGGICEACAAR